MLKLSNKYLFRRCGAQRCSEVSVSEDATSVRKLVEDFYILWASKGGIVDLSKWSKGDFSSGLIPDDID